MTSYCGGVGDSDLLEFQGLLVDVSGAGRGVWGLGESVPEWKTVWTSPSYSKSNH